MILKRNNFLFLILLIAFLLFGHGCSTKRTPTATPRPLPPVYDPENYIKKASGLNIDNACVSGVIRLRINSPEQKLSTRAAISVKRPSFIRFEALNLFNNPVMLFVCNKKNATIFFHQENKLFHGQFSGNSHYMLFGIPISASDFSNILLGILPSFNADESDITVLQDGSNYLFNIICLDGTTINIWIDPENMLPVKFKKLLYGNKVLEVLFSNYQEVNSERAFPFNIKAVLYQHNISLSVTYQSTNFDPIPDNYFSFIPPTNTSVFPLEDLLYEQQD